MSPFRQRTDPQAVTRPDARPRGLFDSLSDDEDERWVQELESVTRRLRASPRWQTYYRTVVVRLRENRQLALETHLAMALSEDPNHFLVLLKTLTDQRLLSRSEVRSFIDAKSGAITPTVFRNSLRSYRRLFLPDRRGDRQKKESLH